MTLVPNTQPRSCPSRGSSTKAQNTLRAGVLVFNTQLSTPHL